MSYNKRQKNKIKRQAFRTLIITSIFFLFLLRGVPSFLANNTKTILAEKAIYLEKIKTEAIIIKKESIVRSNGQGKISKNLIEGDRVGAGVEIATINSFKDTSFLQQELMLIEESILALEESTKETSLIINEKEKLADLGDSIVSQIQNAIYARDYNKVYLSKDQLVTVGDKNQDLSLSDTLVGQSLESLLKKRDSLEEEINSNKEKYYTSHGGIISYKIDGLEDTFLPKNFEKYDYKSLDKKWKLEENIIEDQVAIGEIFCKIIDNFQWYMAIKIEDVLELENFTERDPIEVYIEGHDKAIRGNIISINESENGKVVIGSFDTMLHDFYDLRFPKVEVIKLKKHSFKLPSQVIVDKDGDKGVYIKEKSGIVKFKAINIIGSDSNYTFFQEDNIGLFDEVFVNPNNVKEGQIVN